MGTKLKYKNNFPIQEQWVIKGKEKAHPKIERKKNPTKYQNIEDKISSNTFNKKNSRSIWKKIKYYWTPKKTHNQK